MIYNLVVKEEALQDMSAAFEWYETKLEGLGSEFLDVVDDYFNRIVKNPRLYQSHGNQRVAVINRFPYKIVYEVEENTVVVYAVFHDKRNPQKIVDRR